MGYIIISLGTATRVSIACVHRIDSGNIFTLLYPCDLQLGLYKLYSLFWRRELAVLEVKQCNLIGRMQETKLIFWRRKLAILGEKQRYFVGETTLK